MPNTTPSRPDQIGALFAQYGESLRRIVADRVTTDAAIIEDACGFAWVQLLTHEYVDLDNHYRVVYGWLLTTAEREAWRLHCAALRHLPPGACDDALSAKADNSVDIPQQIEDREQLRAFCDELDRRWPGDRAVLVLRAYGYSWQEIGDQVSVGKLDKRLRRAQDLAETWHEHGG